MPQNKVQAHILEERGYPIPAGGYIVQYAGKTHGGFHTTVADACVTLRKVMGLGTHANLPLRAPQGQWKYKAKQVMPMKMERRVRCLLRYAAARESRVPSAVGPANVMSSLAHVEICEAMHSTEAALHFTSLSLKYGPCKSWLFTWHGATLVFIDSATQHACARGCSE